MKLYYDLSKTYREAQFVSTGVTPAQRASVTLDPALLTPAHRAHLVRVTHQPSVPSEYSLRNYSVSWNHKPDRDHNRPVILDTPATDADALDLFEDDMARYEACLVACEAKRAEKEVADAAAAAAKAERAAAEREQALADAQAKVQRESDKQSWVQAHGSEHLRRAVAAGYDCQRLYVTERAAMEHPGFVVDFDDRAEWRSRSCPTEVALTLAEQHGGTVVWLTREPVDDDDYDRDGREAVVVREYLGKYDLVK